MENLASPYRFVLNLVQELEAGQSARMAVKKYVRDERDDFSDLLLQWLCLVEQGQPQLFQKQKDTMNSFRRALFDLLDLSLQGVGILEPLQQLELELREVSENDLDAHLGRLPFLLMIPLLVFQFPALLLLILGPLLVHLMREVQ